jgi:uncharacterized protein
VPKPAPEAPFPSATPLEALAVVAICFGWFIFVSLTTVAAGFPHASGFSDSAFVQIIAMELVLGGAALSLLHARGYPIARLLPTPSVRGGLIGIGLFVAALLIWGLVAELFPGGELERQPIVDIMAATQVSTPWVVALSIVNGLYEETFLVGYLLRGFRASGPALAIGLSVLVRLLYHLYQGPVGAVSVLVFGVVVSLFYWRTGRLWPIVVAHVLADLLAFG